MHFPSTYLISKWPSLRWIPKQGEVLKYLVAIYLYIYLFNVLIFLFQKDMSLIQIFPLLACHPPSTTLKFFIRWWYLSSLWNRALTYEASRSCTALTDSRTLKKAQSRRSAVKENTLYINKDMQHHWRKSTTNNLSLSNFLNLMGSFASNKALEQVSSQNLLKMCTHKAFGSIPPLWLYCFINLLKHFISTLLNKRM